MLNKLQFLIHYYFDRVKIWRHNSQHNDIQPNDNQHNEIQPNNTQHNEIQPNNTA
jgi:hypothetical protein